MSNVEGLAYASRTLKSPVKSHGCNAVAIHIVYIAHSLFGTSRVSRSRARRLRIANRESEDSKLPQEISRRGWSEFVLRRFLGFWSRELPRYDCEAEANAGRSVRFPEDIPDVRLLLATSEERDQVAETTSQGHPVFLRRELYVILRHGDMDDL